MGAAFDFDFIVIGSGFGGSVSALRLSEKGYSVGVMEMGKRWTAADFARSNLNIRKYIWSPKLFLHGILQITQLKDVSVFHGAGVGGGSLVYANTLLVPPTRAFRDPRWPTDEDWEAKLAPHYDTAKFMLGATVATELNASDHMIREIVEEDYGRGATFHRHTVGVYFGEPGRKAADPFFGGEGPERVGCIQCGECMSGCRHGAKNTLDRNYLYLAERRGCVIHPETRVVDVIPLDGGGYEVVTECSTSIFRKNRRVRRARGVVFSASVLGTVNLLARLKANGRLPKLSARLGDFVRTNSEAILSVVAKKKGAVDYTRGVAITSGVYPNDNTHVEIVRYGKGHDFCGLLATPMTGGGPPWPRWMRWVGNNIRHPLNFLAMLNPFGWAERAAIILVMQPVDNYLRLALKRRPWGAKLDSQLAEGERPPTYMPLANHLGARMAQKMDGRPQSILMEAIADTSSTAHILGGAIMGRSPEEGVCDPTGRVYGYENLFVADGSLVPANLGVNPSLTITALSEYVMSTVAPKKGAEQKPAPRPAAKMLA